MQNNTARGVAVSRQATLNVARLCYLAWCYCCENDGDTFIKTIVAKKHQFSVKKIQNKLRLQSESFEKRAKQLFIII